MYHRNPAPPLSPRMAGMVERLRRQILAERRSSAGELRRLRAALEQKEASLRAARVELRRAQEQVVVAQGEAESARRQAIQARTESRTARPTPPTPNESSADAPALADARRRLHQLAADLANLRRRQGEEQARARSEARAGLLSGFVEILDGMERALDASTDTHSAWHEGSVALHRQMAHLLEREGIERLGAAGEAFDPRLHEAVGTTPHADVAPEHIAAIVQSGYRFAGGGLIRPARVVVASQPRAPLSPMM